MAFEFPSTITARKEKKKAEKKKLEKKLEKIIAPLGKKKGMKGDLSQTQFENAVQGKEDILIKKVKEGKDSLKKIVDAATDDNQLGSTERKLTTFRSRFIHSSSTTFKYISKKFSFSAS